MGTIDEAGEKAAAFADADQTNPFAANQRLLFPWAHVERKGPEGLHANCISFSGLPPQVSRRSGLRPFFNRRWFWVLWGGATIRTHTTFKLGPRRSSQWPPPSEQRYTSTDPLNYKR